MTSFLGPAGFFVSLCYMKLSFFLDCRFISLFMFCFAFFFHRILKLFQQFVQQNMAKNPTWKWRSRISTSTDACVKASLPENRHLMWNVFCTTWPVPYRLHNNQSTASCWKALTLGIRGTSIPLDCSLGSQYQKKYSDNFFPSLTRKI